VKECMDETGKRYGALLVLKRAKAPSRGVSWLCRCDCGRETIVHGSHLRSGHTRSCGCLSRLIDETGNRYGRLLVLRQDGQDKHQCAMWICRCDCGNEVRVQGTNLRRGGVQSCGCLRIERSREANALSDGVAAFHRLYRTYARNARRRGFSFDLTKEEFYAMTSKPCHYCGAEPGYTSSVESDTGDYVYNGIDRKDNAKGYSVSNVVPCCWLCNRAKGDMPYKVFLTYIGRLVDHWGNCS